MENELIDLCIMVTLLGGYFFGTILAVEGFFRLKAKVTGEKYESPIVW